MCTAITLKSRQGENFFGRTMDFSYDIAPMLYVVPSGYIWRNVLNSRQFRDIYSFIGIGQELDGILAFFDGVNEKGFAAAALYFAGYASYSPQPASPTAEQVASYDFLHYILGRCSSVGELAPLLRRLSVVGVADPVTKTAAPLHWIATDRSGKCVTIELTDKGFLLHDNPIGVMANSPDLPWHMTNLRNYVEASPKQTEEAVWGDVRLSPFGQGGGTSVLPGGFTAPERFVRAAFLKTHLPTPRDRSEAVVSCFRIVESVSVPKGAVVTARGTMDYTRYTAFMNTATCEYFVQTYDNPQIRTASLSRGGRPVLRPTVLGSLARPLSFERL